MALGQRDASVLRRFEEFCALEGLRFDRSLDDAHVVEAFLTVSCSTLRAHSLGTYRSTLRRLGRAPRTTREFPASPAPPPYGTRDLAALWSRARHQASRARVTNATVLLATMVGAGLRPREVAWLRGSDVLYSNGRVVVVVRERAASPRLVPVSEPSASVLTGLARERRGYLFRPNATVRDTKNLVGEIAATLVGDPGEVVLSSGRCRSTFICTHLANDTPLRELCAIAGLLDVESLARYARHVPSAPQTKAQLRALTKRQP
jgi:integrase